MKKFYCVCEVGFYFQGPIFNVKFQHISCLNFSCSLLNQTRRMRNFLHLMFYFLLTTTTLKVRSRIYRNF